MKKILVTLCVLFCSLANANPIWNGDVCSTKTYIVVGTVLGGAVGAGLVAATVPVSGPVSLMFTGAGAMFVGSAGAAFGGLSGAALGAARCAKLNATRYMAKAEDFGESSYYRYTNWRKYND